MISKQWQHALAWTSLLAVGLTARPVRAEGGRLQLAADAQSLPKLQPGVVLIVIETDQGPRLATGSFINDHQLLTSGHSVLTKRGQAAQVYLAELDASEQQLEIQTASLDVAVHPSYAQDPQSHPENDLAVVSFPVGSAPSQARIHTRAPRPNESIVLVGLEAKAPEQTTEAPDTIKLEPSSFQQTPAQVNGAEVRGQAASHGDGVLYLDGHMVGVLARSQTTPGRREWGVYAELHREENRRFLEEQLD